AVHHRLRRAPDPHKRGHALLCRLRPPARRQGPARRNRPHLRTRHTHSRRNQDARYRYRQPRRRRLPVVWL
ncbi:MAG: hypothetical protein AVDCRST_MAG02-3375, partial [uncultured Rubrobacteraceae bacterium]